MCNTAILQNSIGTHRSWMLQSTFQENWENSLLCMDFCLILLFWRRDGELPVLKTMEGNKSIQGKVIFHLCACSLRPIFTFLVNHVLVNELSEVSEYLWKGLWWCTNLNSCIIRIIYNALGAHSLWFWKESFLKQLKSIPWYAINLGVFTP